MRTYRDGTISLTSGSSAVVGVGTRFLANVSIGDIIICENGHCFEVVAVPDDTHLTVDTNAKITITIGYAAMRFVTSVNFRDLNIKMEQFLNDRQVNLMEFLDWQTGTATGGPNSDGLYPITDRYGVKRLFACPALLANGYDSSAESAATAVAAAATAVAAAADATAPSQAAIDAIMAISSGDYTVKVNDQRALYSLTLVGGENLARPPLTALQAPTVTGPKVRIAAGNVIVPRTMTPIATKTPTAANLFRVSANAGRNGSDVLNGKIQFGIAWFNSIKAVAATAETIFSELVEPSAASNFVEFTFGSTGSGADLIVPAGVTYGLPFIRLTGTTGNMVVDWLTCQDISASEKQFNDKITDVADTERGEFPHRIGDFKQNFSLSIAGGPNSARPVIPASVSTVPSATGTNLLLGPNATIAPRTLVPLNTRSTPSESLTRVLAVFGRYGVDPNVGTVSVGVAWFTSTRAAHATPSTTFGSYVDINDISKDVEFSFGVAGSGADIIAPAGACYALPFIKLVSAGQILVTVLRSESASKAEKALDARITATDAATNLRVTNLDTKFSLKEDHAATPLSLFTDGATTGTVFDFTNPIPMGLTLANQNVPLVNPIAGAITLAPLVIAQVAQGRLNRGRLGLYSHTTDAIMRSSAPILPASGPFTLVFSHVVDIADRQDTFWQHGASQPGRVQIGANTVFTGGAQVRADGKFQIYIDGITDGQGGGGQPLGASHPIGEPGVFSLVVAPGVGMSEFRRNGVLIDRFTAPPVVYQTPSCLFGNSLTQGMGQTFGRMVVINRALASAELEMVTQWCGDSLGVVVPTDRPKAFVEPTLVSDSLTSVYIKPDGSAETIFEKAETATLLPASLTKTLSALILMDNVLDLNERFAFVAGDATTGSGNNMLAGDSITFYDALCNLMLPSSNVTATAVARVVGQKILTAEGGTGDPTERFVQAMNAKCAALGLTGSNFKNPHGLYHVDQYTTTKDFAKIGVEALKYETMLGVWGRKTYDINVLGPSPRIVSITTSVDMLSNGDPDILGGKTGTLTGYPLGGYNLLVYSEAPNGNKLLSVSIRAPSDAERYTDMRAALDAVRFGYQWPLAKPMKNT